MSNAINCQIDKNRPPPVGAGDSDTVQQHGGPVSCRRAAQEAKSFLILPRSIYGLQGFVAVTHDRRQSLNQEAPMQNLIQIAAETVVRCHCGCNAYLEILYYVAASPCVVACCSRCGQLYEITPAQACYGGEQALVVQDELGTVVFKCLELSPCIYRGSRPQRLGVARSGCT